MCQEGVFSIIIIGKLSQILGFDRKIQFSAGINRRFLFGKFSKDMFRERYHMFIYSHVVEPQIVGL